MASSVRSEAARAERTSEAGERSAGSAGAEQGTGDAAFHGLPGVVNDLPEVAPHEWIYIMS